MSTRTRILLSVEGTVMAKGPMAIIELLKQTGHVPRRRALEGYFGTKRMRLLMAAKDLPAGFSFVLIQEPRRTRKKKSLYLKQWTRGVLQL